MFSQIFPEVKKSHEEVDSAARSMDLTAYDCMTAAFFYKWLFHNILSFFPSAQIAEPD